MNIQLLNRRLAEEFGRTDQGEPRFKWVRTTDFHYYYKTGRLVEGRTPAGLITMRNEWTRHPYSRVYGDHWLLAEWRPACVYDTDGSRREVDESEWFRQMGGAFPYPHNGEHVPLDSTIMPTGVEPDERLTQFMIQRLRIHLGLTAAQHQMLAEMTVQKASDADQRMWDDALDDAFPAFGSIPRDRLSEKTRHNLERVKHVSFPTTKKQELATV